ncbi:hypothetical protein ACTJJ0_25345 [Chitinophaga sp. 22321]|uniref:Uncharacterized protein n=1 Tax=Chitinophaga hostae TaxID=2831022 RepID=A0ABS5J5J4_9BACT|nr:hypothetical protein [Chitinophaga hostae]MBS0030487.1 hypothetical protein [Chitinophaga hostae]
MRIIKILLFLLTFGQAAFATDAALAKILESLTSQQRTLLYQYGTLHTWAGPAPADSFWQQHRTALGAITPEQGKLLAAELLTNTELVYAVKQPSRLQALRGVFTASRLLLGLAALIGAFAVFQLLGKYLPGIWQWLVRHFYPLFRWLFSPRMLSWELLAAGIAAVYFGPLLPEVVIRTSLIHLGFALIWMQLTAITTREHGAKQYVDILRRSYGDYYTPLQAFIHIAVPAILVSVAVFWVMMVCPDAWYRYEVIVPAMTGVFALPPLRSMEAALSRGLFPFHESHLRKQDRRFAAYIVISIGVWVVLLLLPVTLNESLLMLTVFVVGMLLMLSIIEATHCGMPNYWWLQVVTLCFLFAAVLAGAQLGLLFVTWTGMIGLLAFVLIKYWELPVALGWSWKNKKAWGTLGMALLIWGIAALIRLRPEWFAIFPG